ncbi:MAG: glycosyltransferase [Synechococcaceae cyanobacterium MAG-AL2]|uniref:glycosyltransferase family 2 protein n=1 Tax=Candidatus Regnicoccus frigidus TaxID=3074015 RepID=UPI00282F2C75|nr:glycosyltransferase [Candidatus Regnicoccus frigidus]MCT4368472.1 glycosyltransferase [Candidatus Regnicoccus frigidus MAG-AL2]
MPSPYLSIVIPTYNREQVLMDTVYALLPLIKALPRLGSATAELLLIDQTPHHEQATEMQLSELVANGQLRWLRLPKPHLTSAMNCGLIEGHGEIILYLDDDIIPSTTLLSSHLETHACQPEAWAVVGQVLQPGESPEYHRHRPTGSVLWRDLDFAFNGTEPVWIENVIACNLSVKRKEATELGGFDEQFPPPVAARFESEFAKRLVASGGLIRFAPEASIHHLASPSGGTRSRGSHLTSASPRYGVGDCYYAMRCGRGWDRFWYLFRKPFREVRTRFHLRHPWWIPVKFIGELRALVQALLLMKAPPKLISRNIKT